MVRGQLPLPESIGRFKVEALLGRGGMGEVYKAFDPTLQRTVAVKTVRPDIDRPDYLERMMREAQACARLSHPNIVTIFEAGQVDGMVYIAMEYLQGRNLADVLEQGGLTFEEKVRILAKVLEALHHAHGLDVVHRDIKPSNIHVQSDGTIKLMDFGLARMMTADTLTASGNVLGTPHYMSPEQLKGEDIDRRTDVYSAGVMAYEMLAGRRPFEPDNESISSVILKVISSVAPPMDTDMSRMLPEIEQIVSRAMAKSPGERYQSADEMRQALLRFLEVSRARITAIESAAPAVRSTVVVPTPSGVAAVSAPVVADTHRGNRTLWWAGAAAAVVVVVGGVLALSNPAADEAAGHVTAPETTAAPAVTTPSVKPLPATDAVADTGRRLAEDTKAIASATSPATSSAPPVRPAEPPAVVPRELGAKQLFASTAGVNVAPGIRFRMMQLGQDERPVDVDPAQDFRTGDRIRFAFESNINGYLYVAQQGTSGNWTVLFPNPNINGGRNAVKRFEEYEVPQGDWFQFSGNPGTEQVFVFLSREPLKTLPGFDRPVNSFERGSPTLVAELAGSIQSRDLILQKDAASAGKGSQATYVVNKADLGKAVTASFTLAHKP
jgi:serine/threonine-protein kinase